MKTHIVQPGEENLEIIAKKYNLNPGDLAIYNRIANNDNLVPGQEIKLELPKDAKPIVVRLGKNDTLETVAKQFNTSVDRLMALNNLPNTNVSEGATLVAWDPFRMNYTNISKAEDLDTLAKQLNTSKDLLLKSNPHVDPNDIKPNTSLFVPWQLNRYVEPPKETKTYSPPKEAPKEEPVDEVPPKTEPLKVDKVPAYAGEKEGEFLLKNYYDHHVFLTEKPTMKPSNWWDKLWGFNDLYREREKEKYIKDITDELLKATNDAFKAYKKAEKEGDRYEMQKQLTWIDNTHKEFERITGIKKGFDPAVVVKDIMRPEARIAEEEANKMEKELALLRAKETDIAGLPESVLSDDEALLDYSTDTFENLNEVQTEGIKKGYIVRKDIDPKTVNPESIDAIINYSGFSLTDKAKSMLDDFKKANDIPYDISKLSENLTKYFGEFNTDISNALYEQDYNKRVKNQKEFLRKYEDLAIVHEQINPNFLKYNQLYLDYSDLNNKIENILLDLKSINNSDIILEALTSGNLEAYKERLDSLGIKQSDIAKVGNLLSEYEAYSDKIVAIQSGFSQINQDLENDLELFTKALNNFDTNLNIKEFFISEANPTSEFGKSIKSLATLSFEASKLRGSTIEDNKRLVEFQDFLNWYQSYVEAATSNFNAISLLNIRNDMWQNISGLTEQRKSEAKNFANWFNPKYNDITFGERAYTTFVESLVNLTKVPVVGDVAEKVFSALDWYNNVALVEYVFPVAKTYRSTVDMAGWLLPRKLELEANLLVGNYSEEEKERQRREFEEKFQQQAETRFGLKDYDLRNIDLVWSHFATGSLEKKVIPIYDSNGNMMKDSNGNIMTSEIFYNKIRLQRDWDLFEVLKKGNRLDLLQDIRDLNEGKDLRNLKAGDYINLPKLDYGSRGPLIRGGEDFWWSPQDYFENAITNPTATEGVNLLVEIFLDPGTYILKSPYALAKGSIVSPIKFLTGKNIKGLSAITNEALIAVHKALEHNFSFPTFEKFFPKIQDLHASWNKKVIEGIEAFAPKEKKATSWWQIPAQIDAIQGKILNIVKSYPVSRLAIEGISNTIDLFSKPVDQFSFKLLTEANSSVLNIFDNFKLDYLSDHVPTTKTVFNKIKEHQVVSVNLSSGKKIVGVVNRAPSGAGLRGSIRTKGKDIILDSNSFDVKLKDGTVVTVYEKNVSDIFTFNSKEVREMTTSWKKTNPKEKYFYDTIKYNLPGIKVNKVNTFNLKKGDYIVSGQDIGSVVSVKDNKVKIKTFDNNENLIEKEIIPTKEVSLIDEEYIKNLNFNWKNAYANTLLPLKKALAVTTGGIQWFIDYLALGTLLNRLPFELRARANNLINKATATLIAKSSLSATEIWKYFADAFEDSQRRYLLTRKLRIDNKWVELKWNEVWNSKTKKIEVVENPDKKFVLEEKFRSLLLEPGGASLDDWKILSKYNVYPSDIYKAIQKLLTRLSRGDEVANLLKQKSDLINDLIKVLDVNNLNLEGRRISSHFNEDWNKYLIKKGITSRKVREDIVHAANDFGKKIANIDDENLISTARNEIKQIYGEFVSKEAEAVWNIYKEYVSDLLEKQKTQIDSVIVDLPAGVDITFESVEKKLGRLDEIVFQKRTFVNRGGEPVYVFEPGAKKADMIEAIGRLSYEEKLLQVNEKILEGFNVAKIIEDFYEDAFIGNKKTYKLYKDYLAVNKKAELPDFIAWVDTYQSLKRSDFSSYKLLKDTISKQIKGSSPSDKLRLELMELLDSKFPLLRTHDYTKTVDTLLNAKRMSDKAFSDAAKVLDHYLNKRRHPVVLSNKKFMVIDTETTGLNVAKDDAFQFSWKIIDGDGKVIDTHNYYRAFDSKFTEAKFLSEDALKAQKVHGITIEKLKESNPKDIKEIINAFAESISSVDSIIAHNSDFDIEFIKKAIEEADGSPDAIFRGIDIIDTNKRNVIDKGWEGGKLDDLYRKYMGGSLVGAHNALKDVDALIDIYKKALREGKLNERIFKSQEKNIYNNLVKLRDQLDVFQKRIELPVGIGKQFNFVATKTLTPERIKVIREEVARNLFNQESERLFNLSTEDIVKELSIPGAISKAIKDGQVAHSPRKNIIGDFKDKNIRDILFFNQDKFKEIDSKIKKINKDLEKGKLTSVEKKKLIKELDTLNFEKSQYDPIKNNLPENSGIRVISEDYVPDEKELADLKKLIDDGWRFVVYSKSRSRLSNDPPAVKLLRSLGLAEEYQMKSPEAAGKLFDFYVYNTKSNKLLSRDLVGITSEYVDEYTTVPGILGILYRSTDSKEYIVSLYKKLSKKLKTVDPEEDITKVINSSYFFDTIYNFVIRNKNIFKGKEFEEFLPRFRFLKNLRKAKSSPDVSILMINSIENLKLNNVNVDVVLLGKLNKEQLKAVNHFNDVIEMEELNLSPNIRLEDKINKTREIKKYNDEISIKLEAEDKVAYPKIELTNEDLNAVKKIIDDVSSKVFDDLTPLKKFVKNQDIDIEKSLIDGENISIESYVNKLFKETEEDYRALRFSEFEITKKGSEEEPLAGSSGDLIKHTFDRWIDDQLDILNIVSYEDLDTIKSLMKSIGAKEQIRENFQGKKVFVYEISLNDAYYYRVKGLDPNALIHKPKVTKKEYLNVKTSYIVPGVYGGKTVNFVFGDGSFIIKGHYGHFKNVDNKIVYSIDTSPENIKKLALKDGDIIYTNTTMAENFKKFNATDAIFPVKVKEYNGDYLDEPSNIVDLTRGGRKKDLYNIYIVKNEKLRKPRIENVYTGKAYDGSGYHIKGKDGKFYDKKGYDPDGYDIDGFNRDGFDRKGFDKNGYNIDGLDALGFDKDGFHWFNGLNKDGTKHKSGVSKSEYNKFLLDITGYGLDGFDLKGFSKNKYHIDDYKKTGFGPDGRDKLGFDKNKVNSDGIHINEYKYKKGFVTDGRDKLGFDKKDINRYGYHRDVYKKNVYDFDGYDIYGFNKDGFNRKNKHKSSYERNDLNSDKELRENGYIGYDRNGRDIYGFDRDGFDKNGNHIGEYLNDGFAKDGYNIYNFDRDGFHRTKRYHKNDYINGFGPNGKDVYGFGRDGFNDKGINIKGERKGFDPDGYNKDGYDREGYDRKGFDRSGYDRDGYNLRMEHKDGGYNLDTLRSIIEKNIDTEKKSYYLLDDVGWRNDKYSDVSFVIEEMPSLDLPNQHTEVIVPKKAAITKTVEVREEFPDSFAIKKEDGTSMFIEGNTKTKINNIIFKSKSTGDYSLFFPPKFLFDFDKIDLDRTRLIKKLLPEDSPKTDYIVIDVPNNSYINKLKKDLDTLDLDALKKYDLEKDIEKAIKERDSADAFEKVIKETDELKGIKIYRISSIEGIALEENLESINKFRDSRFNKENGLFISSNPDKTKEFLDFKLFTPRESKILENMNNVFTEIKDLVRSEKLHGKSAFYTKQFSIFSEPVNLDKSIESLVRNIERGAAVDDLEKVILETVTKTKRAWDGKNVVVIALDDATSLTGEFYEAINDIIEKNKRLKTKTKILFPDHPNLLERDAKAYLLSRGFDENLIGVVDLDHVPVAKTYKDFKITDQTKAIKDLINLQNEKMSRASYSLVIGKIEDDVAGIIPKRLLLAQNSKEAGILVMSDNLILKDQINVMKGFLVENTDSAYKFPSAGIRDELFNKKITFQRALEKTIIASSRKEFQKEWVKFINEETNAYRETVESQYKPYLAGGSNIELELYREMVEEQVQRFRDAFKPIEKYILKWDGSEPVLDKYLRSARERVLKDLINDIAEGKRDRAIFENYLEKGDVPTVGYFLRKNLGYNTTKFLIALPGYLQTIFIQSVLRLMPRWSINNALDDLIKTLIFDRDFKKFLSGIWLQGKIFVNFYGTLLKHGKIDVSNSIMSNFFRLQKKLGIINNKEFNLKIRKLPKKGFYDLSELLKEWGHEDWSKMIRYIDDITIVKKDKKGKSILDKEGREVSQTYSAIDLDYMMSTGIQEIYSSPEEALLYFKRIIPKNANPLERIGFKAKEWNANLDMFYSQTERLRRAIALQRALQDQTIDMAKAKAFVSDFFFDYKAVNRAGVFFRKFFPFFTFSYFTARLYLKLLLGRYGYQTFRAGVAIMQIWEANTAHLPEMYKDRISIKIGDREFLIRPNISLIDVMRFVFDPSKEIEQTFENPRKLFFGLGYGPIVGPIVEELTGATYFKPSESEMKAMGWNYGEIKKELQKYEDSKAGETWIDTWWKLVYSIVPHIEIIEKLFFKADVEFQQTGNILKSSKFREISKMFAINILERDAVDAFTQKLYSLPPSVRNYYINQIKESDPELYEEWQRQSLISLNNNLIVKGVSEEERIRTLDKRRAQNEYYRLEAQEKGAGSEWLDKNPYQKELLEEVWRDSPKSAYDEYREKLRLIDEDRRTIRQIVEETLPSNLENEKNIERYKALGYDYQPVNRDKLIKDLTNKDLNIHQMNVLLAYKYPDVGLDFIRKSQIDQKRAESEEYKALSLEEKKELSLADQAYYKKINILNRFLPDKDATEEEVQKAFELRKKQIDKIFTPEEKKRYLDSIPESQKILEKAMTDYIERWGKIIENSEDGKYWESLNSQPSWFKEFYFLNNPEVRVYLPLALEREKRLGEVIEMEKRGFSTIKERKALNDWFWAHEKEIKAWESHSPETIERYRERKEYDENFYFPLQSFANIKNWQGYYNFLLSPSNKKYLDMWSRMGSSERTEEQIKEEAEQKIKMAKLSKEYYSLPSTTWNDQKKKQEWLNNNSELRDWWDRNKSKEELELSKKAQVYFDMKFDIEDEGSGYDYYLKFREINVKRQDYLNNNPDVLKYINSNEEGTLLEPSTIKRKLAIYNTLSDEKKREYLDNNKDLAKYFLDGVPSGIRKVRELQEEYFNIKESQFKTKDEFYDARNKFLKDNPNLKKYWDAMAMPSSYFLDKQKFNKYQVDLSKVLKYYDSISANNLSDSMRISLLNMNSYMVPGNSEEDKWMMNKVYESAMQTWIRLLDENKSVGMYFFRQLPTWIRARYYDNHPDKRVLSNYSLNQWFGQPIWRYNKNNPSVNWALEQQRKYGKNIPISIKRQVEKILISAGEWEDRSSWTSEKWKEWQTDRAARLNGLKQKDVDTNPLLRKELYRATVFFKRNAPIDPKIYNKKIKFMNLPDNSVFLSSCQRRPFPLGEG